MVAMTQPLSRKAMVVMVVHNHRQEKQWLYTTTVKKSNGCKGCTQPLSRKAMVAMVLHNHFPEMQ